MRNGRERVLVPASIESAPRSVAASERAEALAQRLEEGAGALAAFASTLTDAEWRTPFGTTG